MSIVSTIKPLISGALTAIYHQDIQPADLTVSLTKPEFEGDYTLVLFSFVKQLKKSPEALGKEIGDYLLAQHPGLFTRFNVIKGFLNLSISDSYWIDFLQSSYNNGEPGRLDANGQRVIVEYSSPNTNKPLHLGHLRNNFLGWSVAQILKTTGYTVTKTAILNDRGIHICKSMAAWEAFGNGDTPESTGIKPDHFVGDYYVKAENTIKEQAAIIVDRFLKNDLTDVEQDPDKKEIQQLLDKYRELSAKTEAAAGAAKVLDQLKDHARKNTAFMKTTQQMLLAWEMNDPHTRALWNKMNGWVYEGFNETYKKIGSDFDKNYFESDTYLLGKEFVEEGLAKGVFYKKADGSVWIDLTADGLDEKLVLRKDGTSVYITQDLGLADNKYKEFRYDQSIYVIADEQNYHMKVLKLILEKLGKPYAKGIYHLSYGLVELPSGRMKTREGTVVDADDLIEELKKVASEKTEELGKVEDFSPGELNELYDTIALGALKFFILRVDPKKRMVFNPEESIDFHGFTGPFIQFIHARIKSILRKEKAMAGPLQTKDLLPMERELIILLEQYPAVILQAANEHDPSAIAIYVYEVAKTFSSFYTALKVLAAETEEKKQLRLQISEMTANVIAAAMRLLGIRVPERM
ncbi:MAG TPA: arginine--tRNA ligase [Chitinophagaceae bacterium]|nr:arginine--tRNA ligase [Chitinophagaceae bacterium]